MFINKLRDIVSKYNNTYYKTTKMKPVYAESDILNILTMLKNRLTLVKTLRIKILNLKLVMLLEHQNRKNIFVKGYVPVGLQKFLLLQKLQLLFHGRLLLVI